MGNWQIVPFLIASLLWLSSTAQEQPYYHYIQNHGQWPDHVVAQVEIENGHFWVEKEAFTWHFWDLSAISAVHGTNTDVSALAGQTKIKGHVYKTNFAGANPEAAISYEGQQKTYYNYFLGNDPEKWKGEVPAFAGMRYNGLYQGIDLHVYSSDFTLKYDFILEPGADPTQIAFQYEGVESISLRNGRLIIETSVNEMVEQAPIAWQVAKNGEKIPVSCRYVLQGDMVGFEFDSKLDPNLKTVIDPVLVFSTYSGSTSDNFGYTASFDDEGFLYSGSSSFGTGYPITTGAYQSDWGGGDGQGFLAGTDIALSKFDVSGTFMVWSTYLGADNDELPHSLIVTPGGELLVFGTSSSPEFPTTDDAYSSSFNGGSTIAPSGVGVEYVNGSDIIVTKFTPDGTNLIASTFLGGSGNDGVNTAPELKFNYADEFRGEIELDNEGNVYIASCTYSDDFPVVGGFQATNEGGLDGCIVKFNEDLSDVLYSTYIGDTGDDGVYSLAITTDNNVYACGGTTSQNFPVTTGAYQETYGGGSADGFIYLIPEDGSSIIAGTLLGSNAYDQCYFVEVDKNNVPHIYGQTLAPGETFIINADYGNINSGMLVAKLELSLDELTWSTVFGNNNGEPNLSPTAFLVDVCGKIYLSGWGGTTNTNSNPQTDTVFNMDLTDDAFQDNTNGSDFYLLVIEDDASDIVYGSYFGGLNSSEHVDGGTSRFNRKGEIYQSVCAGCGSNDDFPIFPPNAHSPTNNSNNCNLGVFKFDFELPITVADFFIPPLGCVNEPIAFQNNSNVSIEFFWDFGDETTSTFPNPIHEYEEPGIYEVMLVANHPATCNLTDTLFRTIEILEPQTTQLGDLEICSGQSVQLGPVPQEPIFGYEWDPIETLDDPDSAEPTATPTEDTDYILLLDNGACVDTLFQTVEVISLDLSLPEDIVLCGPGDIITLEATSSETGVEWLWSSDEDFTDQLNVDEDDNDIDVLVDEETSYYVQATLGECVTTEEVSISFIVGALNLGGDQVVCAGDTLTISIQNDLPGFTLEWYPEDVIISGQGTQSIDIVVPDETVVGVNASDGDECDLNGEITVDVSGISLDQINASADPTNIITGESTTLTANPPGFDYVWFPSTGVNDPDAQITTASPEETTTYYLTVADGECIYNDSVTVRVFDFTCGPPSIYVPNAFTPNADSQNELLYVRGNFITDLYFVIYDRWGEKVFETTELSKGWDGRYKGRPVDPAVYVYYLEAVCEDGQEFFDKGNITVIR
ncbi:MAG: gliding motility-associated C-terminal domain-containing protein [Flavobacteriales bacterium]|nr:gliding motility-associated C-terminal domain-containing protein [Flavobacteriales bacterium]